MRIEESIQNGILVRNVIYEESDKRTSDEKLVLLEICNICEFKNGGFCGECGCLLESRMYYKETNCPINKW